jgi:succinate dehydrogenase hydrophobic anchor subunit
MSGMGMKVIDFVFVVTVFFHAGFGLNTIIGDYVSDRRLRTGLKIVSSFVMTVFAYLGVKLVAKI